MNETDLSYASNQELIGEIKRRSEAFVIAAIFKADQRVSDSEVATCEFGGGVYTGLGLVNQLERDLVLHLHMVGVTKQGPEQREQIDDGNP